MLDPLLHSYARVSASPVLLAQQFPNNQQNNTATNTPSFCLLSLCYSIPSNAGRQAGIQDKLVVSE
jgi:hypothetical protein